MRYEVVAETLREVPAYRSRVVPIRRPDVDQQQTPALAWLRGSVWANGTHRRGRGQGSGLQVRGWDGHVTIDLVIIRPVPLQGKSFLIPRFWRVSPIGDENTSGGST